MKDKKTQAAPSSPPRSLRMFYGSCPDGAFLQENDPIRLSGRNHLWGLNQSALASFPTVGLRRLRTDSSRHGIRAVDLVGVPSERELQGLKIQTGGRQSACGRRLGHLRLLAGIRNR